MTPEQQAADTLRKAYFDLKKHPSEAGPEAGRLLDEFIRAAEARVAQAIRRLQEESAKGTDNKNSRIVAGKYCWICKSIMTYRPNETNTTGGTWVCPNRCDLTHLSAD